MFEDFEKYRESGVASLMVPCRVVDGELTVADPERLIEAQEYEVWLKEGATS